MKKLAILGASYLQVPLIKKAIEMGLEAHVFAWEDGAIGKDISDFFYPISILEKDLILKKCEEIQINGITSVGSDVAVNTINYIAKKMELVGNSDFTTEVTRDKGLMRELLQRNDLPTVKFSQIDSELDLEKIDLSFPYMIKSVDRSGSRGVNFVKNIQEAKEAFQESRNESFSKRVICEEYFQGKQYSVEMISQGGDHYFVGLTEEFYSGPPFFVETGHIVPGKIENSNFNELLKVVKTTLNVVGMTNGASHTEIRLNENGEFCIIEVASRMGGDFRDLMVLNSYGYDFLGNTIKVALGERIEIPQNISNCFSFVKWILSEEDFNKISSNNISFNIISKEIPKFESLAKNTIKDSSQRIGYVLAFADEYPSWVN
jgi:biotin carboxylase